MNREFLMLSKDFDPAKHRVGGLYWSEKLDGLRAIWIPKARNMPVALLPFANTEKDKKVITATGLFSRYGKVIYAPDWFLDKLPPYPLDGELYTQRQEFNKIMSITKRHEPDDRWSEVRFKIFDAPTYAMLFTDGRINNQIYKKQIDFKANELALSGFKEDRAYQNFEFTLRWLRKESNDWNSDVVQLHDLTLLPWSTAAAMSELYQKLAEITDDGGEGIVIRHPSAVWEPLRSQYSFKVKYEQDAEARVVGYKMGFGKHEGRLGSLCCVFNGVRFDVSGFTDLERVVVNAGSFAPGHVTSEPISDNFLLNSTITFTYRELTPDGCPKEARYKRKQISND